MFIYFQSRLSDLSDLIEKTEQSNSKVLTSLHDVLQLLKSDIYRLYEKYRQLSKKPEVQYDIHPLGFKYKGTVIYDYYTLDPIGHFSKNSFKLDTKKFPLFISDLILRYKALTYINKYNSYLSEDEILPYIRTHNIRIREKDLYTWNKNRFGYWYHRPTGYILEPNKFNIIGKHTNSGAILCFSDSDFAIFRQWEQHKECPLTSKNIPKLFLDEYKNCCNNKIF